MGSPESRARTLRDRLTLMVITPRVRPLEMVEAALRGGATAIQLRGKGASTRELLALARRLRELTAAAGALFIVNDRVDVALAAGAEGAHLGDDDLPLEVARSIVPDGFILGYSVDNAEEACSAEQGGASYIGLGPIYPTSSKADTGPVVGPRGIAGVRSVVSLPIVGIGGIAIESAAEVVRAGADGVAVIGAVADAAEPEDAARQLTAEVRRGYAQRRSTL